MLFDLTETKREHMDEVIQILKGISSYSPPKASYDNIWAAFHKQPNVYSRIAAYKGSVVGYGVIIIETKIRGGKVGHIEDIVTHSNFRLKNIGATIVKSLCELADIKGCYKVTLHCKKEQIAFYEKCLFKIGGTGMQKFNIEVAPQS